jgi:hypothetical protein
MKKIIFVLLILPLAISAQRYDPYYTNSEFDIIDAMCTNFPYKSDPSFNKCYFLYQYHLKRFDESSNDLQKFASFFFAMLAKKYEERYPNDESYRDKYNNYKLYLFQNSEKIKFTFQTFNDQTIAIAKSMGDSNYEIVVDPAKWNRARVAEKVWIMFHELAHEYFSTMHGQGGGMMFPISAGDNISLNRLWNGWDAMGDWLVKNRRRQIKSLHKDFQFKLKK